MEGNIGGIKAKNELFFDLAKMETITAVGILEHTGIEKYLRMVSGLKDRSPRINKATSFWKPVLQEDKNNRKN